MIEWWATDPKNIGLSFLRPWRIKRKITHFTMIWLYLRNAAGA
jgi:hypothetical protein